jgi:signal transduction histidine kinase
VAIWLFDQLAVLLAFLIIKFLVLDRVPVGPNRTWLNLSVVMALGTFRAIFSFWMQTSWGLPTSVDLGFAILLSSAFSLVHFGAGTNFEQSLKLYRGTLSELVATQKQLLGLRESSEVILLEEEQKLVQQTQAELLPQLEKLDSSLESTGLNRVARAKLVQDIRGTIENQVRPLSDELKSSARFLAVHREPALTQVGALRFPKQINLHDSFRPGEIFALSAVVFVAAGYIVVGPLWGFFGLIAALHMFLWLKVIRFAIPVSATLPAWLAYFAVALLSTLPLIPVVSVLFVYAMSFQHVLIASVVIVGAVLMSAIGMAVLHGIYRDLEAAEAQLSASIDELRRETSRFEQRIWAARRNWGYIIHGTVQSSLTAALMHLQKQNGTDETPIDLVRREIGRALEALRMRERVARNLSTAITELTETWQGVCDIELSISDAARQALLADPDLCLCTQEILKEAVANAVRHGGASQLTVSLEVYGGHSLVLEAVNNGRVVGAGAEPGFGDGGGGLGSQIIRDLSYFWSLESDETSGLTTLTAKMALPNLAGGG